MSDLCRHEVLRWSCAMCLGEDLAAVQAQLGEARRLLRDVRCAATDGELEEMLGTHLFDDLRTATDGLLPGVASPPVLLDPVEAVLATPCEIHEGGKNGNACVISINFPNPAEHFVCLKRIRASRSPSPGVGPLPCFPSVQRFNGPTCPECNCIMIPDGDKVKCVNCGTTAASPGVGDGG